MLWIAKSIWSTSKKGRKDFRNVFENAPPLEKILNLPPWSSRFCKIRIQNGNPKPIFFYYRLPYQLLKRHSKVSIITKWFLKVLLVVSFLTWKCLVLTHFYVLFCYSAVLFCKNSMSNGVVTKLCIDFRAWSLLIEKFFKALTWVV